MSRNGSGTYTLPTGNPVVSGTLIEATWANSTLSDIASALTDSLSRSGQGGMTAAFRAFDGTSSVPGIAWGSETTTGWYRAGAGDMRLVVTGSEVIRYQSTGVAVTGTLSVSGNATVGGTLAITGAVTLTANPTLSAGTANGVAYLNGSKVLTTGSALVFDGTNFGVGTSSPAAKLHSTSSSNQLTISESSALGATFDYQSSTGNLSIATNGINPRTSPQIVLNLNGNLGLGVTPSASTLPTLQSSFGILSGNNQTNIIRNGYYTDTWRYTASGTANLYNQINGEHRFYNATSGTAGNAISFTQAMTLDASGNLGLNTSSPVALNSGGGYFTVNNASSGGGVVFQNNAANIAYAIADTDGLRLDTFTGKILKFGIQGSERARIDSSGNLLVGKTSAAASSGNGCWLSNNGLMSVVGSSSLADTFNYFNSTAGVYRFYVNNSGVINATSTTITAISDQRLKENIQDIDVGLDKIMALKPRKFDWKAGKGKDIRGDRGWIAQEFEQVFPEMITTWKDEPPEGEEPYKAVNADLIPVLVKAIQEQQAIINAQSAALEQLKAQLTSVSADVAALKGTA